MHRRQVGRLTAAVLCVVLSLGAALPTYADEKADRSRELDRILKEVRQELAESSEAMVAAAADLRLAERALPGARQTLGDVQRLLGEARRREATAARRRGEAQTRLMLATLSQERSAALVAEQRVRIGRIAREAYQSGGSLGEMAMLLESRTPADFAERLVALQTVVSAQRSALAELTSVQEAYGHQATGLEEVRDELARAHEQAQDELATVAELESRARAAQDAVSQLVAARERALEAAGAAAAEDERRLAHLASESSALQEILAAEARRELGAAGNRPGSSVPPQPNTLGRPVQGPITSPFGMRVHPITGVLKLHTGVDLGAACGTPIRAARAGTVIDAAFNTAYGWRTVVSHGAVGGALLTTTYNHQKDLQVLEGQRVAAGQVIGVVGTTGYSTGCHLHFELIVNSDLVDPVPWMVGR